METVSDELIENFIAHFLDHHDIKEINAVKSPIRINDLDKLLPFHANFIRAVGSSNQLLVQIVQKAHERKIHALVKLCAIYVASKVRGQNKEELDKIFGN